MAEYGPSFLGRRLTGSSSWHLRCSGLELILTVEQRSYVFNVASDSDYRIRQGYLWTDITLFPGKERELKVDGLPNPLGVALTHVLKAALDKKHLDDDVTFLENVHHQLSTWLEHKSGQEKHCVFNHRWLTHDIQASIMASRPALDADAIRERLKKQGVALLLGQKAQQLKQSLVDWETDPVPAWTALNNTHTELELKSCKDLFDRVESKPLTEEQARAVICFDNRVQVVASAGSGKTSTMVAKAAYAIHRGWVAPDRIVMMAFNKQAAEELKERAEKSFERLGMQGVKVAASTFHALGLSIIGKATGSKPDIPDWATDTVRGFRKLTDLIDQLKDDSTTFRTQWDLFRFVFARDLPTPGGADIVDTWDAQGAGRLRTANGETVKSLEEKMIADWLFYQGVEYRYEDSYQYETADEDHRQYRPDFYYPELDLYHEHFALNAQGLPPDNFEGYLEGVQWKRQLHYDRGTSLFETTSYGLRQGNDLQRLATKLTSLGIILDPNPDRPIPPKGQKPMESVELVGLVRTFISHVKSNSLSIGTLRHRLKDLPGGAFINRYQMFLDIVEPILEAWDAALRAEGGIDFEDMLNLAASHLESGRYVAPYELVMADEFQDASRARARLCRALVQKPHRFLFAVGDDWQSINRFAGADVAVMTGFKQWFGHGQVLKLEQTFRCPQALCDISSTFIAKNPAQMAKSVHSATPAHGPVLQAFQADSKDKLADAIDQFVMTLAESVRDGSISPGRDGKVSVFILGRYNSDRQYLPSQVSRFNRWVNVSFLTIHRSKGSEADYVILPEMISISRGRSFPNTRTDDPILAMAMPDGDKFPLGEERRLFYVAMTRARRSVAMFTVKGKYSSFLRELKQDGKISVTDVGGKAIQEESCPLCKQGVMVLRSGPYGEFHSCSNFPDCGYKSNKRNPSRLQPASPLAQMRPRPAPVSEPSVATVQKPNVQPKLSFRKSFINVLADINKNLDQHLLVENATSELKLRINEERRTIEAALTMSQSDLRVEVKMKDPLFRANYERLQKILSSSVDNHHRDARETGRPIPVFVRQADPVAEAAVGPIVERLRKEREAFLSVVHAQLSADISLHRYFMKNLSELNGERYMASLRLPPFSPEDKK